VPGLGARLGRGGATTYLQDLATSDCIVIMGANMAENHPVGFRFVTQARERGATVIHIDPRFTRTSALADFHVPLRAGSDLVFLGALVNYVLTQERYFAEYVKHYTNASALVDATFEDTEELAGLFSGYDPTTRCYNPASWQFARSGDANASPTGSETSTEAGSDRTDQSGGPIEHDPTLQHPRSVFQIVKRHFSRYTPEMVEEICGVPRDLFLRVAETVCDNSRADRTTCFAYAVAWTQHTTGSQIISCCALLQLLLGNIGRPGGGIMALRGHATIQGSTDIPTLYNLLPGYLPMPNTDQPHASLAEYLESVTTPTGWWHNTPKYMVSLLRAYYGERARPETRFGYELLPKISGDYSFQQMILMMVDRTIKGLFVMGQNPAVGGMNARLARRGLRSLDWLVVRDAVEIESANFWKDAPEVRDGTVTPEEIGTEVFLLPAALTAEKEGSYTNTQRLVQWHDRAVQPPGDARSEAWFIHDLALRLTGLYAAEDSGAARQLQSLDWAYGADEFGEPDLEAVLAEINGYTVGDRQPVAGFADLKADGSTACGCWIYSGIMPSVGTNLAKNRITGDGASLDWGFSWPANRRILYNRASARPDGSPWSARKAWIWWDSEQQRWVGHDNPDFPIDKSPAYRPATGASGIDAHGGDAPFVMLADGKGQLFTPTGFRDGPLPTHYEPWETPVANRLYPAQDRNPTASLLANSDNRAHAVADPRFPHVLTTYRLTEHHTAGGMTRFVPWLAELQPEGFAEIDPELAAALQIVSGDWLAISTLRGEIETRALVTGRLQPLTIGGEKVHQVGLPWHFGYSGIATGAIANDLSTLVEDPNSLIHEAKSFTCAVRPGRRTNGVGDRASTGATE